MVKKLSHATVFFNTDYKLKEQSMRNVAFEVEVIFTRQS
jgi:hypothetical protein